MSLFEQIKRLLRVTTEAELSFRIQNYFWGYRYAHRINVLLQQFLADFQVIGCDELIAEYLSILELALDALEQQDSIQLADVYEEGLMPILLQTQEILFELEENPLTDQWGKNRRLIKQKDLELYHRILEAREDIPDEYQLSWAKTGDLVLKKKIGNRYIPLNSAFNPWKEASLYKRRIFRENKRRYIILGFGLGYHVELLLRKKGIKEIIVLEHDIRQLAIACSYRDLSKVLQDERFRIICTSQEKDYQKLLLTEDQNTQSCIWYPSMQTLENESLREILENYWVESSTVENMAQELQYNFEKNIAQRDLEISSQKHNFQRKTMILVAAGPSLDDDIMQLKLRKREDTVLVCVGKIAAKLISAGVEPDYIVMLEGMAEARWQINGIEDSKISLIYASTVAAKLVEDYHGPRYIAYQEGFTPAKTLADSKGFPLFQSGGSVATFAIDIGIRLGCHRIICVGLDLGYINGQTHGQGVGNKVADTSRLRKVEGVSTEYVYTNKPMDIYRQWIEKRIASEKNIEFINTSKGARIHGMKEMKLEDCI